MYSEECGFRNFVLMIGKIALMNACSFWDAVAKLSSFDYLRSVEESTSNSSTELLKLQTEGSSTVGEPRRP